MARSVFITDFERQASKRRKVRTRDRYKINAYEERRLMEDVGMNSASHGWGASPRLMDALIDRHRKGNAGMRRVIEEQLHDINYHPEASALEAGDYRAAVQMNKAYHQRQGTKPSARYSALYGLISG